MFSARNHWRHKHFQTMNSGVLLEPCPKGDCAGLCNFTFLILRLRQAFWVHGSGIVYYFVIVIKHHDQMQLRKERLYFGSQLHSHGVSMAESSRSRKLRDLIFTTNKKQSELEIRRCYALSEPTSRDIFPLGRFYLLKCPPSSVPNWDPSVQMHEPMRDISHMASWLKTKLRTSCLLISISSVPAT